ncbi:hypothetical protein T06_5991 [Trichinella sp. T6]|nr:hypothetical protein T06_5991 [Trichinella sp. T6]
MKVVVWWWRQCRGQKKRNKMKLAVVELDCRVLKMNRQKLKVACSHPVHSRDGIDCLELNRRGTCWMFACSKALNQPILSALDLDLMTEIDVCLIVFLLYQLSLIEANSRDNLHTNERERGRYK